MKATLEFNLPEESPEHALAVNAGRLFSVVWDFDQWLRALTKHAGDSQISIEAVREELWKHINSDPVVTALFD